VNEQNDWDYKLTTSNGTDITAWTDGGTLVYPNNEHYWGDPIDKIPCQPQIGKSEITPYPWIRTYPYSNGSDFDEDKFKKLIENANKEEKNKTKEENLMKVFEVTVIDRKECEIIHEQKVVAKDKEIAMLDLNLTPEIKKKVKKNLIEFIFNEIGTFTKVERKIKVKDLDDED
jgi:hypothetical protein